MGNEASKKGIEFPLGGKRSSSNKRSRLLDEAEERSVEMTAIEMTTKSKSKEDAPQKPKTQKELYEEINHYKCLNSSCCKDKGGCFLRNFCSSDQSSMLMDNAINVLQLFREKTRILNKEEEGKLALSLFKAKCTNLTAVISPVCADSKLLYAQEEEGIY